MPWEMQCAGTARMVVVRPGRNEPCPCGSGQKFKHCCGRPVAAMPAGAHVGGGAAAARATPVAARVGGTAAATAAAHLDAREAGALVDAVNKGRLGEAEQRAAALLRVHPASGILWKI